MTAAATKAKPVEVESLREEVRELKVALALALACELPVPHVNRQASRHYLANWSARTLAVERGEGE